MKNFYLFVHLFGTSFFAIAQTSPLAYVHIQDPLPVCSPGNCTTLMADYLTLNATTDYVINSIAYNPSFPFTGGTTMNANADDQWTPTVTLPFSFSFFGTTYNSILVGTNGVITFDLINFGPSGFCPWFFSQTVPSNTFPIQNAIYGVYQDSDIATPPVTNPAIQNVNYYVLDSGEHTVPNRVFVINYNELPHYGCNASLQTSQIVLYETTNTIDINVKNRTSCTNWNSGNGLIGIQNQAGTVAFTPPARNTGTWSASNEAWRFTPNGSALPIAFLWYDNEVQIMGATSNSLVVCPSPSDNFKVKMVITNPNATQTVIESNVVNQILIPEPNFQAPVDLSFCTQDPAVYVADLESNTNIVLGNLSPSDYVVTYYESWVDAENGTSNNITNTHNYSFIENKTIYVAIQEDVQTGCRYVKQFQLIIVPAVAPPIGSSSQDFLSGQTLANLQVTGENIVWYDASTNGNLLPNTTLLVDNTTYYASQIVNGCETNRNVNTNRLAVSVHLVLNNTSFTSSSYLVYPNPVDDFVTVSSKEVIKSIRIFNVLGQEILLVSPNEKESKINTSKFSKGVYFIRINSVNGNKTVKINKE